MGRKGLIRQTDFRPAFYDPEFRAETGVAHPDLPCRSDGLSDVLYGVSAIAAHLGTSEGWAWNLFETGMIPAWIDGRALCASRSAIEGTFVEREAAIRAAIMAGHE